MNHHQRLACAGLGGILLIGALSCTTTMDESMAFEAVTVDSPTTSDSSNVEDASPFDAALLAAARDYRAWPRVTHTPGWKPELCSVPPMLRMSDTFLSRSEDTDTHGKKLYHLYPSAFEQYWTVSQIVEEQARHRYPLLDHASAMDEAERHRVPPGFVIVKETWSSAYHANAELVATARAWLNEFRPVAERDGQLYVTDEREELFMMLKTDPTTPGTDQGWVYGVVSTDGQTVLASGLIDSCIGCHRKAPADRLFGMPGGLMMPTTTRGEMGGW